MPVLLSRPFFRSQDQDRDLGLQASRPRLLAIRSRDRDLDKMNSSLETMVSRSQHVPNANTGRGRAVAKLDSTLVGFQQSVVDKATDQL